MTSDLRALTGLYDPPDTSKLDGKLGRRLVAMTESGESEEAENVGDLGRERGVLVYHNDCG